MKTSGFAPPPAPQLKPSAASFVAGADTRVTEPAMPAPAAPQASDGETEAVKPVRITVDLPPALHRRAKIEALNQGKAMSDLIREWIEIHCKP